ncbi:hypothetical protein GC722_08245 [Auraticoccus sp. F435]|uniref:Uncharacterized protein n=1 Tax=Auraticoccus cholistanensis TaxID=2656650 RepID=A0A6A9UWK1_9ACTN|nr:rhamnogalacturonan lyase [Auraticoccus cholistanensis]MVA76012.1 hypothetical protein [Auraticoccus cholistanensis]
MHPLPRTGLAVGLTTALVTTSLALAPAAEAAPPHANLAPATDTRWAEDLDRAPVAVRTDDGNVLSWRVLGSDRPGVMFHVYRDGERITRAPLRGATSFVDADGAPGSRYRVEAVGRPAAHPSTEEFGVWSQNHLDVPLDKPAGGVTPAGESYDYRANDASVGDLDGDGQYELVLKWEPRNAKDNSQAGYTGSTYLDAYELAGTRLWRLDLGRNIRSGAHYTQFMVYDLDSDGDAEVTLKTADGTVDGRGTVIGDASADHREPDGYVLSGPEYLTVFDGRTGAALDTVDYVPPRGSVASWGDGYGNRVDRFLATVAYLDGEHPSVVFSRGYYTRAVVAAWNFDGEDLTSRWVFDSDEVGKQYEGQGNHNLASADVDADGRDEIVFGSMTLDDDGELLYNTGLGHGDALHVSDFDPARPGLEVFAPHESMSTSGNRGATYRDAATGEVLWSIPAVRDTGRAAMADIDPTHEGAEGWATGSEGPELRNVSGELLATTVPAANFVTWWDGDLLREIADHQYDSASQLGTPTVSKWNWEADRSEEVFRAEGTTTNNTTKGNPALQADLLGDWREELVYPITDYTALRIYTTTAPTEHKVTTLMHDRTYRLGVATQNVAYNQPPHTGYHLGA